MDTISTTLVRRLPQGLSTRTLVPELVEILVLATAVAVAGAFAFVVAGAGAGAVAVAVAGAVAGAIAVTFLCLYLLLPCANAVLDWLSWWATRWLLGHLMASASRRLAVAGHAGLDLVLAAGFLALLAFVLPMVMEAARSMFGAFGWGDLDWRSMLEAAKAEPLGSGIMVTGMLATTLLPTAIHFFVASLALLIPNFDMSRPSKSRLRRWMHTSEPQYFIRIGIVGWLAGGALISWLVLVLIGTTTYGLVSAFGPDAGGILLWIAEQGAAIGAF